MQCLKARPLKKKGSSLSILKMVQQKQKRGGGCGKFADHKNELSGFYQAEKQEEERACDSEAQDQR